MKLLVIQSGGNSGTWIPYLIIFIILIGLFFIQKYTFLIDRKVNQLSQSNQLWEGKPWPLITGMILGIYTYLYNVFSPEGMQIKPSQWGLAEAILIVAFLALLIGLAIESKKHFSGKYGISRFFIFLLISAGYYCAGYFMGFFIAALLALIVLIYFINFWRKKLTIK